MRQNVTLLCGLMLLLVIGRGCASGPKYPITASWFKDRFTLRDWNLTLAEFQEQGGDTVLLRAPSIVKRTRDDLARDPDFAWCGSAHSSSGATGEACYDEAVTELASLGLNVTAFVTYEYEEAFSDVIMACPRVDRKINSSRVYHRIVLPAGDFNESRELCDFPSGSDVVVLLTSFAGTDAHALLLATAAQRNMSVYFGLPAAPRAVSTGITTDSPFDTSLMGAYYGWVDRVLHEHQARYSAVPVKGKVTPRRPSKRSSRSWRSSSRSRRSLEGQSVYNKSLAGYFSREECSLAKINPSSAVVTLYQRLGKKVRAYAGKKLAASPSIDLRAQPPSQSPSPSPYQPPSPSQPPLGATVDQHVTGLQAVAATAKVDVIAVQEGRGAGRGCYYWSTQRHLPVSRLDSTLDRVLHYLNPDLKPNITFQEAFTASNQELFAAFEQSRDRLVGEKAASFELWLSVEAFESLRDDPCLPVDTACSGIGQMLNRASKARVDRALTAASVNVQKVAAFAWDSDFTCSTQRYKAPLAASIRASFNTPIIANCSFHSSFNRSIVVIGYNLLALQQSYEINWPQEGGKRTTSSLYGYYFETDWGIQHNRVESLIYTQLFDLPGVLLNLEQKGWISVRAKGAADICIFEYDFTNPAFSRDVSHSLRRFR